MGNDILLSDYLNIDFSKFKEKGIFDSILNHDSAFFINVLRLKNAKTPEFSDSYNRFNDYFMGIATLLDNADEKNIKDKCYKAALKSFAFSEVNGINLGFSQSSTGAGFGRQLSKQVIEDAYVMVKRGCNAPELFHLLQLFEEGVGPDRLSDMIGTIIMPDIQAYTKRVMEELEINAEKYPQETFDNNGFLHNPFKNCPIYFLPVEILHELPVARSWEDVENVINENNIIRNEINHEIGEKWKKWHASERKQYIKQHIFMNPEVFGRVLQEYRKEELNEVDLKTDVNYYITKLWQVAKENMDYATKYDKKDDVTSLDGALEMIEIFKDWVENNRGWDIVNGVSEKIVQRLIHLGAKEYLTRNNLDLSCEANEGPGPVDFKISRGNDKTVIELKLSSNQDYLHGYEEQVERYAEAENTDKMIFILVDVGNSGRVNKLLKVYEENKRRGKKMPRVCIINAKIQVSASKRA